MFVLSLMNSRLKICNNLCASASVSMVKNALRICPHKFTIVCIELGDMKLTVVVHCVCMQTKMNIVARARYVHKLAINFAHIH